MKQIHKSLKEYTSRLHTDGWFDQCNLKEEMPVMPSCSMMHALWDGYQIVLYSCTYNTDLGKLKVYRKSLLQIILGPNMGVMWHEVLLHCGSISHFDSITQLTKEDMRLFTYIWQEH